MPKRFDNCVSKGGYIKTVSKPGNKYQRICYLDGKEFKGEVKKRKGRK